ncbi:hypothetical protein BFU36_00885 [Sulfolobus sp. A20]|uniref:hypothetical protein n=1 Tax=Saccharolobus sp. A20 TaxID=1891280 RepID=UPI00084605E8|nr:hypothetical protein [Sulfolobus sp. A20]AOL15527.1 hypothetical protein BFU36_00885 [Sulfolobus sp. A20]
MIFIDFNTHYGIELYKYTNLPPLKDKDIEIERIVLNPIYKYSCNCCVDGFYQQYLWSKDKKFISRLGIYNPNCRISPEVEIERQYQKGIVGIVLNPSHHNFSLLHPKLNFVYSFAEKRNLIIVVYNPNINELREILSKYSFTVVLINNKNVINDRRVYYMINHESEIVNSDSIYGSDSPYNSLDLIESAREFVKTHDYNEVIAFKNALSLLHETNI